MEKTNGFVIAGTNSGSGKTTVSLGLMAWFRQQGYSVAPFKVGPDFIDPGHHSRVADAVSRNLDGWMLSKAYNIDTYRTYAAMADIAIVEGVMGLFDGFDGTSEDGSTAQMAKWLNLPVILVVNARSMARSVAALVKGFVEFDPELNVAGIILNNLGSNTHYTYLSEAMAAYSSIPLLGGLPRDSKITLPERHLGLVTTDEHVLDQEAIGRLADMIGQNLDTGALIKETIKKTGRIIDSNSHKSATEAAPRIGVARDAAFCFYYEDNLDMLEANGATLVYFSPLADKTLPERLSGIYLGGGYPEMFAERLAENSSLREAIKDAGTDEMPIYGECGGFMYLCRAFQAKSGKRFPMAGCFPFETRLLARLKALGYREVTVKEDTLAGAKGAVARGHEFHYSEIIDAAYPVDRRYLISGRKGGPPREEGFCVNQTLGSWVHLHFGSNPAFCRTFVTACKNYMTFKHGQRDENKRN